MIASAATVLERCLDDREVQALTSGSPLPDGAVDQLAHLGRCDACRALVAQLARASTNGRADDAAESLAAISPCGATIDRYVVEDRIGHGGMGVVYAAYDPQLDRRIALKLVRADRAASPVLRERLVREARMMARVCHEHVITVYDAGVVDDQVFIAMELVAGRTLREWLRAEQRPWRSVVAQFVRAGRGLAAAHALGIVHRDFKPDNVLVGDDGRVRVSDFGLAVPATAPVRAEGRVVGTPAYMAPEQRRGAAVDARSDQYSFCVALYEALTGTLPRADDDGAGWRLAARAGVPARLRRAVARGMAPIPSARFPRIEPLIDELERHVHARRGRVARRATLFVALCAIVGTVTVGVVRDRPRAVASPVSVSSVRRLSYAAGCEEYPAFAGGDALVVFDGDADGGRQLFAIDPRTGATQQLTFGAGSSRAPLVSPDGRRIAYEYQLDGVRQLRVRRVDGVGGERPLGDGSTLGGAWLDDRRLAIIGAGGALFSVDVDGDGARRPLFAAGEPHRFGLLAALDDGTLAASWWQPPSGIGFGLLSASGLRVLVDRLPYVDGALQAAPAHDAFYFVRRAGPANELVRVSRAGGEPVAVGGGIAPGRGFAIARDGTRLVFSTCASRAQLWRIGDDGPAVTLFERTQPWSDTAPVPIDARRLLFASDRSGHDQLYVADVGAHAVPTSLSERDVEEGAASADGRWLAYSAHDPGGVWVVPLDGTSRPVRVTDGAHDEAPQLSRRGDTIYFTRGDAIFAVPRSGGTARLVAQPGREPAASHRDDRLFFLQPGTDRQQIMVMEEGGTIAPLGVALPRGNCWSLTASPDGRSLALVHEGFEIVEVPLDGHGVARVRARSPRWISSLSYTWDGAAFWASLETLDGDLWLADGRFR